MTGGAGSCNADGRMVWIGGLVEGGHMTIGTVCRCARETVCMATGARSRGVGPGEWEYSGVVVESPLGTSGGVTGETGRAVVSVTVHRLVFAVHIGLVVIMAVDAGELCIVACILMAVGAIGPLAIVFSRINGELRIMLRIIGWFPTWGSSVAVGACLGESGSAVIRVGRIVVICQMTRYALLG